MSRLAKTTAGGDDRSVERDTLRDQRRAEDAGPEDRQDDQLDETMAPSGHEDGGDDRPTTRVMSQGEPAEQAAGEDDDGCDAQCQQALSRAARRSRP